MFNVNYYQRSNIGGVKRVELKRESSCIYACRNDVKQHVIRVAVVETCASD